VPGDGAPAAGAHDAAPAHDAALAHDAAPAHDAALAHDAAPAHDVAPSHGGDPVPGNASEHGAGPEPEPENTSVHHPAPEPHEQVKLSSDEFETLAAVDPDAARALAWDELEQTATNFPDNETASQYGVDHWNEYIDNLDADHKRSVILYSGAPYEVINSDLRAGRLDVSSYRADIHRIDDVLSSHPVQEPIIVNRAMGLDHLKGPTGDALTPRQMVGKTFNDPAFMSTSLGDAAFEQGKPAILHVAVPEGTPAAYIDAISAVKGEREVLLGRDLSYTVDRVLFYDKKWHLFGRIN
jgi:hypothetical protein